MSTIKDKAVIFDYDNTLTSLNVTNLLAYNKSEPTMQLRKQVIDKYSSKIPVLHEIMNRMSKNIQNLYSHINLASISDNPSHNKIINAPVSQLIQLLAASEIKVDASSGTKVFVPIPDAKSPQLIEYIPIFIMDVLFGGHERQLKLTKLLSDIKKADYTTIISSRGNFLAIIITLKIVSLYNVFDLIHVSNLGILSNGNYQLYPEHKFYADKNRDIGKSQLIIALVQSGCTNIIYIDDAIKDYNLLCKTGCTIKNNIHTCSLVLSPTSLLPCNLIYIGTLIHEGNGISDHEIDIIENIMHTSNELLPPFTDIPKMESKLAIPLSVVSPKPKMEIKLPAPIPPLLDQEVKLPIPIPPVVEREIKLPAPILPLINKPKMEPPSEIKCVMGKDGKKYYFQNGQRVSSKNIKGPLPPCLPSV